MGFISSIFGKAKNDSSRSSNEQSLIDRWIVDNSPISAPTPVGGAGPDNSAPTHLIPIGEAHDNPTSAQPTPPATPKPVEQLKEPSIPTIGSSPLTAVPALSPTLPSLSAPAFQLEPDATPPQVQLANSVPIEAPTVPPFENQVAPPSETASAFQAAPNAIGSLDTPVGDTSAITRGETKAFDIPPQLVPVKTPTPEPIQDLTHIDPPVVNQESTSAPGASADSVLKSQLLANLRAPTDAVKVKAAPVDISGVTAPVPPAPLTASAPTPSYMAADSKLSATY